ncbi:MAG: YceI family protein [Candidatus Dormibacteraeota bacterium]|uniref:YceI family protein n=1 Tax=Candidatus Dormibacter sp. TaxID=2973982 RepID=UPI000DB2C013|nr:YceI family protein [Candidatus Dormibacteraeota bacterium]PZR67546.1 MAG: YceI family protein [Candidatus Dormibacteraeota bacterium]
MAETYELGPTDGRLTVRTFREGVAARVGHDLVIEVTRWSAVASVDQSQPDKSSLTCKADARSLEVREGTGGAKALTDKDRRDIKGNIDKLLQVDRFPEVNFASQRVAEQAGNGYVVEGELELAGSRQPLRLELTARPGGGFHARCTLVQSEWGIKPYRGFMGALKVRDALELQGEVRLPER